MGLGWDGVGWGGVLRGEGEMGAGGTGKVEWKRGGGCVR